MKFLIYIFLLFLNLGFSQIPPNLLMNSEERIITTLSGLWQRTASDGVTQVELPLAEYNSGIITYTKKIKVPDEIITNKQLHLFFLGLSSDIEISINDNFLGKYLGGMTPFMVKIPRSIIGEKEFIKIDLKVFPASDNIEKTKTKSLDIQKNHYGILRDFYLVSTSQIWMSSFSLSPVSNNGSISLNTNLKISSFQLAKIENDSTANKIGIGSEIELREEIYDKGTLISDNSIFFNSENDRVLDTNIYFDASNMELWSPENPKLYDFKYTLNYNGEVIDDITFRTGLKIIQAKKNGLELNGKSLKIKGVSYIEEFDSSPILTKESIEADLDRISKLGANAIRFKYTLPHPYIAELCDRYGILILADLPAYEIPEDILESKEVQVRLENISIRYSDYYNRFASNMAIGLPKTSFPNVNSKIYSNINSTLIYRYFSSKDIEPDTKADFLIADISKNFNEEDLEYFNKNIEKPVILTYGTMVQTDNNKGYSDPLSLEHQAHILRTLYKISGKNLTGDIFNSFNDYSLENPTLKTNNQDKYLATYGLTSSKRNERISYQTARTLFKSEKEPLLDAGTDSGESNILFVVIGIILTIIFVFLFNRLRRFREYVIRAFFRPYNFYSDIRDQRIISSFQTFVLSIIVSFSFGIFIASILYVSKSYAFFEYLSLILIPSKYLREQLFDFIWVPELLMMILTVIFFFLIYLLSLLLKILSFGIRSRIFLNDTITISVWSLLPLVLLLPMGILSGRLLIENESLLGIFIGISLFLVIWSINRILKSTSVVFDSRPWKIYSIGILILASLIVTPIALLQINHSILSYIEFFLKNYIS